MPPNVPLGERKAAAPGEFKLRALDFPPRQVPGPETGPLGSARPEGFSRPCWVLWQERAVHRSPLLGYYTAPYRGGGSGRWDPRWSLQWA